MTKTSSHENISELRSNALRGLGLAPFCLLFTFFDFTSYYSITNSAVHWLIGIIISVSSILPLLAFFVFGRKYARLAVRGLGICCFIATFVYAFGVVACLYPLLFRPLTTPINLILSLVLAVILTAWTVLALVELRSNLKSLCFYNKFFVSKNDVVEFDLANIHRWEEKIETGAAISPNLLLAANYCGTRSARIIKFAIKC